MRQIRLVQGAVLLAVALGIAPVSASAQRTPAAGHEPVTAGQFVVEPSTLIALGFEWYVQGDSERNAAVAVSYRKKGETTWRDALPLFRINGERTRYWGFDYTAPNLFAGSIFDLEPDTEYECRFRLTDPDGVKGGKAEQFLTVRTRKEPQPYAGGHTYHVYVPGYAGARQEPSFDGLLGAYYTGSVGGDWYNAFPPRVKPGDVILVHAGVYKDQRFRYGHELTSGWKECCYTTGDGTYYLTQKGTPDKPIVIKAAGDGDVVFDGDGNYTLFNVTAGDHTYFEGITFRNTSIAIEAGRKNIAGTKGLTVKRSRFEAVGIGIHTDYEGSREFYIADNVFLGLHDPSTLTGWTPVPPWRDQPEFLEKSKLRSQYAVKVYGPGHVIAYNRVENFHDGIDHATYGNPDGYPNPVREHMPVSIDIYNNDISNVHDNCIEADGAMHNIRVLRNRCTNTAADGVSMQPVEAGPAYFIRNTIYQSPASGAIKLAGNPAGGIFYHNTFTAGATLGPASNVHFRNNLILLQKPASPVFSLNTYDRYSSSDYNGFFYAAGVDGAFRWLRPAGDRMVDYEGQATGTESRVSAASASSMTNFRELRERSGGREDLRFKTLAEFSQATGLDRHSIEVTYDVFRNAPPADVWTPTRVYAPGSIDLSLKDGAAPIDAGVVLPNVNDDFTGKAPDLGAVENGRQTPHYGPRADPGPRTSGTSGR